MRAELRARRRNIGLLVSYDGTNYAGFQRQSPPSVAIQNVLEERLSRIFGDGIELVGAGRTHLKALAFARADLVAAAVVVMFCVLVGILSDAS